jgi:hypothetical protein
MVDVEGWCCFPQQYPFGEPTIVARLGLSVDARPGWQLFAPDDAHDVVWALLIVFFLKAIAYPVIGLAEYV